MARRPCWMVLAPVGRIGMRRAVTGHDWKICEGDGSWAAAVETEPGSECAGDDELAKVVSRGSEAYVLWFDEESPRVQAFVDGEYAGEVKAWPDHVAAYFGCVHAGLRADKPDALDLTPYKSPEAAPGELKIAGWTARQWQHSMEMEADWSVLLDGASEKSVGEVLAALDHPDREVRTLACRLARGLGVHGLGERAGEALARLRAMDEPEAANELAEAIEREAVRREFPWIRNFHPERVAEAAAALDDPRESVRIELYFWWSNARDLPASLRDEVAGKLRRLIGRERGLTREIAESALERVSMQEE